MTEWVIPEKILALRLTRNSLTMPMPFGATELSPGSGIPKLLLLARNHW